MIRTYFFLLFTSFYFLSIPVKAQPVDSFANAVDSSSKAIEKATNDFQRWQDSVQREKILRNVESNGKSLDAFLQEMKEKEEKQKRRTYFRIGAGVLFLFALFVTIARRSRSKKRS